MARPCSTLWLPIAKATYPKVVSPDGQRRRLTAAYGVFQQEAQDIHKGYQAQDGERRWLGIDPSGLAGIVPGGGAAALLPARLAQHPQPRQAQ